MSYHTKVQQVCLAEVLGGAALQENVSKTVIGNGIIQPSVDILGRDTDDSVGIVTSTPIQRQGNRGSFCGRVRRFFCLPQSPDTGEYQLSTTRKIYQKFVFL
jgi:hypothetical protein